MKSRPIRRTFAKCLLYYTDQQSALSRRSLGPLKWVFRTIWMQRITERPKPQLSPPRSAIATKNQTSRSASEPAASLRTTRGDIYILENVSRLPSNPILRAAWEQAEAVIIILSISFTTACSAIRTQTIDSSDPLSAQPLARKLHQHPGTWIALKTVWRFFLSSTNSFVRAVHILKETVARVWDLLDLAGP